MDWRLWRTRPFGRAIGAMTAALLLAALVVAGKIAVVVRAWWVHRHDPSAGADEGEPTVDDLGGW